MNAPKVVIVTLNWKRKEDTIECVRSVLNIDYPNYDVVIVDNGSKDGSAETFKKEFHNVTKVDHVNNHENLGYSLGFNTGISRAIELGAEFIMILNNDTIVDKSVVTECVQVFESDVKIGAVSGKVYDYGDPKRLQTAGRVESIKKGVITHVGAGEIDDGQYEERKDYEFLDDVFLVVRKTVFDEVGMYDDNFFLYYEETDLCARIRRAGYRLVFTPHAKIWHKGSLSSGGGTNPTNTYYLARNKIVFMYRNYQAQFRRFLIYHLLVNLPKQQIMHIKNNRFNCMGPTIKGTFSAIEWVKNN